MYSVYMLISPSGKKYIGMTSKDVVRRWESGRGYAHNSYLTQAINKYDWTAFQKVVVAENLSKATAEKLEQELILKFNTTDRTKGYNILPGGNVSNGHTEETRRKISETMKRLQTPEIRARKAEVSRNKVWTAEAREKCRQANIGNKNALGAIRSPEVRKKMSDSQKGHFVSEETRKRISQLKKGKIRIYDENGGYHYGMA